MRPHGDEYRWRLEAPRSVPSISVIEPHEDVVKEREESAGGAEAMPFGFSRVLPRPEPPEPLLWEGDGA